MSNDSSFGGRKSPSVSKKTRRAQMAEERKSVRFQEALERQQERNNRSAQEQLTILDKRKCIATKERAKLLKLIETQLMEENVKENTKNLRAKKSK